MKFRKKPVEVYAVQITQQLLASVSVYSELIPDVWNQSCYVLIKTLEGDMRGDIGDWLVTGVKGEPYAVKPDIFEQTYEPVIARPE